MEAIEMKPIFSLVWLVSLVACPVMAATAKDLPGDASGWALMWSDEFDGTKLDRTKWAPEKSCWGGGNDERQCYTARDENIRVADGMLRLIARKERYTGPDRPPEIAATPNLRVTQPFTSGKIRTRGIASWQYGKIEFRAKPPKGQGTWPAVWMMPADDHYGAWPLSGEIDILEGVNLGAICGVCAGNVGENRMISALHFGDKAPKNEFLDVRIALPGLALPSDDFHVWTLEWGKGIMRFYLDGIKYWEVTADKWRTASPKAKSNAAAPFDQPFYIMANLAIGGRLSEDNNQKGVADDVTPAQLMIDWIRIYQCKNDRATGLACMQHVKGSL
jgi:beta-glucanase (GH16 family)